MTWTRGGTVSNPRNMICGSQFKTNKEKKDNSDRIQKSSHFEWFVTKNTFKFAIELTICLI